MVLFSYLSFKILDMLLYTHSLYAREPFPTFYKLIGSLSMTLDLGIQI